MGDKDPEQPQAEGRRGEISPEPLPPSCVACTKPQVASHPMPTQPSVGSEVRVSPTPTPTHISSSPVASMKIYQKPV